MNLYYQGALLGLCTFLIIGIFHPIVIKAEYYFGTRSWWAFLVAGIVTIVGALQLENVFYSAVLAIVGFSCLWSIIEIFEQRQRVIKGWFPMNPQRKHTYPADAVPYQGKPKKR